MHKVIYNAYTGHVENAERCAVVEVPDDVPASQMETYLAIHAFEVDGSVIGFSEAREILMLVLDAEVPDPVVRYRILMGFADAVLATFN